MTVPFKSFVDADKTDNSGTAITGWEPGKHYIYYITFGANAITFSATINPWVAEVSGYRYLVN